MVSKPLPYTPVQLDIMIDSFDVISLIIIILYMNLSEIYFIVHSSLHY